MNGPRNMSPEWSPWSDQLGWLAEPGSFEVLLGGLHDALFSFGICLVGRARETTAERFVRFHSGCLFPGEFRHGTCLLTSIPGSFPLSLSLGCGWSPRSLPSWEWSQVWVLPGVCSPLPYLVDIGARHSFVGPLRGPSSVVALWSRPVVEVSGQLGNFVCKHGVGAHNMCIGCSGAQALHHCRDFFPNSHFKTDFMSWIACAAEVLIPFFLTLLMGLLVGLCQALLAAARHRREAVNAPTLLARSLCVACPVRPVLCWRRDDGRRRGQRPLHRLPRLGFCQRMLLSLVGFCHMPGVVWAAPPFGSAANFVRTFLPDASLGEPVPGPASSFPDPFDGDVGVFEPDKFYFLPAGPPGPPPCSSWDTSVLGVSVFAPHYEPTFFRLHVPANASLEEVLDKVTSPGCLPSETVDVVVPVSLQRYGDALSLLAFPSALSQLVPLHCAVLIDLSFVGGHFYASTVPCDLTLERLLMHIDRHMWYRIDAVDVWVNDSEIPASGGTLSVAPGTVFTVLLKGMRPDPPHTAAQVLCHRHSWGPLERSPSPRRAVGDAVADLSSVRAMPFSLLSSPSFEHTVRNALGLPSDADTLQTQVHLHFDLFGDQCHTVHAGLAPVQPWLLDLRPVGFSMQLFRSELPPSASEVAACLPCGLSPHHCLKICAVASGTGQDVLPVLRVSLEAIAAPPSCEFAVDRPLEHKCPSRATSPLRDAVQAAVNDAHVELLPDPLLRIGDVPPAPALGMQPAEEGDAGSDDEGGLMPITVLLFAPELTPEEIRLRLHTPCSVDDVVSRLAEECDERRYALFPQHIPVEPQPSQWWAAFLALPAWAGDEPVILINLCDVDGRCFASGAPNPLSRSQVLRLAQLPDDGTYEVFPFLAFEPMPPEAQVPLVVGGTVTIKRAGARRAVQGFFLPTMLLGGTTWLEDPELPAPPIGNRSLLVHGHGHGVVHPRSGGFRPSVAEVAQLCGACESSVRIVDADLVPSDATCHGYFCHRVFGVSFSEANSLTRGSPHGCVTFIDCRALLQGWSLELTADGRVLHSELADWLDTFSPDGWQPQIEGAPIEDGFLLTQHGAVLTASYVPISSSDEGSSSLPRGPPPPPGAEDDEDSEDEFDSDSPSAEDHTPAAGTEHQQSTSVAPTRDRSRSPVGRRHAYTSGVDPGMLLFTFCGRMLLWCFAFFHVAIAHGRLWTTSVILLSVLPVVSAGHSSLPVVVWPSFATFVFSAWCIWLRSLARLCKLLLEPHSSSASTQMTLAVLRYLAPRLGAAWRYVPATDAPVLVDDEPSDETASEASARLCWCHFVVIMPGFSAEHLEVALWLPATVEEAIHGVQEVRPRHLVRHFPRLIPVSPQPFSGSGVLLGSPAWQQHGPGHPVLLCIDMSRVDGRVFAAFTPDYLCKQQLLTVAGADVDSAPEVFLGGSTEPLEDGAWCHVSPGDTVVLEPPGSTRASLGLGVLLTSAPFFTGRQAPPPLSPAGVCCLIHNDGTFLHFADPSRPFRYREQIAAATGARVSDIRLFPAVPRVQDACIEGYSCNNVTAVCEGRPGTETPPACLLDLRFLLQGWKTIPASAGCINCPAVLATISVPRGWRAVLQGFSANASDVAVSPGQVVVVCLAPNVALPLTAAPVGPGRSTDQAGDFSRDAPAGSDAHQSGSSGQAEAGAPRDTGISEGPAVSADVVSSSPQAAALDMHIAVFMPEYVAELFDVQVDIPVSLDHLLVVLAEGRDPELSCAFPRLVPVPIQPALATVCFIALPAWEVVGVPVLFVCHAPPFRIFAQTVPGVLDADGVLRLARVDPDLPVHIYVGGVPWAVPEGGRFGVRAGELVTIFPIGQPAIPPVGLNVLLNATDGWHPEPLLLSQSDSQAWIATDQASFHAVIPSSPSSPLKDVVAGMLHAPLDSFTLVSAFPAVRDHAHGGLPSRQVYGVSQGGPTAAVPYFLDLRRMLLPMSLDFAPFGRVCVASLCTRLQPICPDGFFIRVRGGYAQGDVANHYRDVFPGQVIIAEFLPCRPRRLPTPAEDDDAPGGADDWDASDDSDDDDEPDSPSHSSGPPASGPVADTGGTRTRQGFPPARARGGYDTWGDSFFGRAVLAGSCRFTSVWPFLLPSCLLLRTVLCCIAHAVAGRFVTVLFGLCRRIVLVAVRSPGAMCVATRCSAVCVLLWVVTMPQGAIGVQIFDLTAGDAPRSRVNLAPTWGAATVFPEAPQTDPRACVPSCRHVPTPCRATWTGAELPGGCPESPDKLCVLASPLVTLLDESKAIHGDAIFFEAHALIETLVEHFHDLSGTFVPVKSEPVPLQLSLALMLDSAPPGAEYAISAEPVQWHDFSEGTCVTPLTTAFMSDLQRFSPVYTAGSLPDHLDRPHRFQSWVAAGSPGVFPADAHTVCLTSDGSFAPKPDSAGWGIVLSALTPAAPSPPGVFVGVAYGTTREVWDFGGAAAGPANAYASELVGLFWAAVAAFQCKFRGPLVFLCDNLAALGAAQGSCDVPFHAVAAACRDLHQGLYFSGWGVPRYEHVRGHTGDPANELADAVAALGASGSSRNPFSLSLHAWFQAAAFKWVPHFCWASRYPEEGPPAKDGTIVWPPVEPPLLLDADDVMLPFTRVARPCSEAAPDGAAELLLSVVSFNTLSIVEVGADHGSGSGLYGCTGRVALLDGALLRHGVFLAGLQETRTPGGTGGSPNFKRYSSGCLDRRTLGVELWVATGRDWPSHTAVVLHTDHTRLYARLTFSGVHLCVFVGHAPHAGHSLAARRDWWAETATLCSRYGLDEDWLLLLDANCKVGSVCSDHIGSLHSDPFDEIGELFHDLLRKCGSWLPSTFSSSFVGDGGTLVQRRSGTLSRSDYIALPCGWKASRVCGRVEPTISAGHSIVDHYAVLVDVAMHIARPPKACRAPRIDGQALLKPENAATVERICSAVPTVGWHTSVHDHAAVVVDALYSGLVSAFPLKNRRMGKHYLSAETTAVHGRTAALRHAVRWRLVAYRAALTRCAFGAWARRIPFIEVFTGRWLHQLRLSLALSSARLHALGKEVRRLCRRDRAAFLASLADEAEAAPPGQVHTAIKKVLRPKKFRRGGPQPLPRLKRPDGTLCTTADAVADEWRRHFAALEGGASISVPDLVTGCACRQRSQGTMTQVPAQEMPSFCDLVSSLRGMQPHRASGPDMLPPSLCARFALPVARLLWPILLKSILFSTESIGLKGGTLHHIAKASSPNPSTAAAQRGILLQPVFSKAIHKTQHLYSRKERHLSKLEAGKAFPTS